jgi:flagellar hook-associated protein 2
MTNFAVDGIVSGMNTTQIVSQLMQLEAMPQTALKNKVTTQQSALSAYQSVNTRLAAMKTAGEVIGGVKIGDLLKPATAWQSLGVTSSSTTVTAAATTAATSGSMTFDVTAIAKAHSRRSDEVTGLGTSIATTAGISITVGTNPAVNIALTDTSLSGVVSAINANKDLGVTAAAVQVSDGVYRLQLTSAKSGLANAFTISGLSIGEAVVTEGADAKVRVGGATNPNGYDVVSSSNTFTGVLPGVTFTVSAEATGVTLTSARDTKAIADKMQAMVDSVNFAISDIDRVTAYSATDISKSAPLAGNATLRQIDGRISSTVNQPTAAGKSMSTIGVQLDRTGKLTFDKAKFLEALEKDPAVVQQAAGELAQRVTKVATDATAPSVGLITTAIDGHNSTIKNLNDRISAWDSRLEARRLSIQRQFTAMETALGKMRSQSSWLSGQLGSMG